MSELGANVLDFMTAAQLADVVSGSLSVDVSSAFEAAQDASDFIHVPRHDYLINSEITGQSYKTWQFDGGRLVTTQNTIKMLNFAGKQDFNLLGLLRLSGSYSDGQGKGTYDPQEQHGLVIDGCWKFHVGAVYAENFKGQGVRTRADASGWPGGYGVRGHIASVLGNNCNVAVDTGAGSKGEYIQWGRIIAGNCNYGIRMAAGNHSMTGGIVTDCNIGFVMTGGTNHLHGITTGFQINHNVKSVWAEDVTYGHDFMGCHIYDGPMEFRGCSGIVFNGGVLDPGSITCVDTSSNNAGETRFIGMRMPQGTPTISGESASQVNLVGCF